MKKIFYYIAALVFFGTGCQKYFETPTDLMREEDAYKDMAIADKSLNHLYATPWSEIYNRTPNYLLSGTTDEGDISNMTTGGFEFNRGVQSPSDYPLSGTRWIILYDYIRRTNIYLKNITSVLDLQGIKPQRIGEAKFIKGLLYMELFKNYGRFVTLDEVLNITDDLRRPRNTLEECVNYIVNLADEAAAALPVAHASSELGRATKAAAMALKAEALLFYASPLHNPNNDVARWQAAANAAKAVISNPQFDMYKLYDDYGKLFLVNWNSEIIYAFNASAGTRTMEQAMGPTGSGGWAGVNPTQQLVDAYQMENGLSPFNSDGSVNAASGYNAANPYANRESRFYTTILYNGATWQGRSIEAFVGGADGIEIGSHIRTQTGYFLRKFVDESINLNGTQSRAATWILYRLGTLMLDFAEAENEANGPTAEVYANVNAIRARAKLPALAAGLSKDQMRERIHHERRIEMAFENNRFWDVRRWKIGVEKFNIQIKGMRITKNGNNLTYQVVNVRPRIFDVKRHLFPIPQSEINRNPNMDQNPGW